jgi:hypothetical protein
LEEIILKIKLYKYIKGGSLVVTKNKVAYSWPAWEEK